MRVQKGFVCIFEDPWMLVFQINWKSEILAKKKQRKKVFSVFKSKLWAGSTSSLKRNLLQLLCAAINISWTKYHQWIFEIIRGQRTDKWDMEIADRPTLTKRAKIMWKKIFLFHKSSSNYSFNILKYTHFLSRGVWMKE